MPLALYRLNIKMSYDLAVVGAGWAGYNAAMHARQKGKKVILIEEKEIGGTCLNRGCIPTKALIESAHIYSVLKKAGRFGVSAGEPSFDFSKIQERKDSIVRQLAGGMVNSLGSIELLNSRAKFLSAHSVQAGQRTIEFDKALLAAGSQPCSLPGLSFDGEKILSSDGLLKIKEVPKTLLVIGGGVIGCEFASLFAALGSSVTIVEKMPQLLPGMDPDAAKKLEVSFKKRRIAIFTDSDAFSFIKQDFEKILLCVGRSSSACDLGLEEIGVKLERGRVVVDDHLRTSIPNIYAAGDCASKIMLAHFAAYQGKLAVDNMYSDDPQAVLTDAVPSSIFTEPQVGLVGITQAMAEASGIKIRVYKFDFLGSGMARILDEAEGFIKILTDADTGRVFGAVIVGPKAAELINILAVAVVNRLSIGQLKSVIFSHPSLSETITEAS